MRRVLARVVLASLGFVQCAGSFCGEGSSARRSHVDDVKFCVAG